MAQDLAQGFYVHPDFYAAGCEGMAQHMEVHIPDMRSPQDSLEKILIISGFYVFMGVCQKECVRRSTPPQFPERGEDFFRYGDHPQRRCCFWLIQNNLRPALRFFASYGLHRSSGPENQYRTSAARTVLPGAGRYTFREAAPRIWLPSDAGGGIPP